MQYINKFKLQVNYNTHYQTKNCMLKNGMKQIYSNTGIPTASNNNQNITKFFGYLLVII